MFGVGGGLTRGGIRADADLVAHLGRITTSDSTYIAAVTDLILGLKEDSIWDSIGLLSVVAPTEADSLLNLKGTASDADSGKYGSPNFVANQGFKMTTNNCINLGDGVTNLSNYDLSNGHWMFYTGQEPTDTDGQVYLIANDYRTGSITSYFKYDKYMGGDENEIFCIPGKSFAYSAILTESTHTLKGFIMGQTRTTSTDFVLNDTRYLTNTAGWGFYTEENYPFVLGVEPDGTGGYTGQTELAGVQFRAWSVGDDMGASNIALYENRIRTYMQAIGADSY